MEIGALSLLISEKGFDATMQKVAAIDAAATKVGAKQTALRVTALTTAAETALGRVDTIASTVAGKPVSLRVLLSGLTDVTTGIDAIEAAKERAETPVVIPVPPPDTGPATNALGALAEAEAVQEQRARALTEALAAAGAAGTSTAEKAKVLQSALAADQQATDQLSSATLQLDIRQRDGIDVIKLRTQALNELREAQNQLSREESLASGNFRVRSTPTASAGIPVAVGPQLGPATPEAEAFAQRAAATKAAFEAEAAAARQATIATTGADAALTRTSASTERLSPRLRTAANGLTAVAFAATASNGSFQSMALGAGLAGSALADAFGSSKMAAYASGIGAALVVAGTFVGILERMTDRASRTRTAIDSVLASIRGLRSSGEASAALAVAIRDLARAEDELAVARERLTRGGSPDAISIGADIAAFRTLQKVVDQYAEIRMAAAHQVAVTEIEERDARAKANREVLVQELSAEARARDAAQQARVAKEQVDFDTGRASLDRFLKARLDLIRDSTQREIAVLRARQDALAAPDPNAKAGDAERRAGEIRSINREIEELQARRRQQETETNDQISAQREALDRQIVGFQLREQEAAGDASKARIRQAQLEAVAIERALVQRSGAETPAEIAQAWKDANAAAQQYVDTQTRVIGAQQQQQAAQRIFNRLEIDRLTIQQQLARGEITQAEANERLAATERERLGDLSKIATEMERFGRDLNNQDLIDAARRLRAEINGMANIPLGPLAQRLKSLRDELSVAAAEGNAGAAEILRKLQRDIDANGGKVTVGILLEAEWELSVKQQIEEGFAQQTIVLKPRNVILDSVAQAIGNLNQQLGGLATRVGDSIGGALAAGFSSAFTKGSGKNFFEATGNAILQGIGNTMVQLGSAMLTYGLLMSVAAPFFIAAGVFTQQAISAPAAIAAGTGLIALGAGLGAIAANNTGTRTGGGGGRSGASGRSAQIAPQQVILDPDRRLREARAVAPTVAVNPAAKAAPIQKPFVFAPTIIGPNDPQAVRTIGEMVENAVGRNLIPSLR